MTDTFTESALAYHREPRPGKLAINATKPLANQRDLALAYSPGVAAASALIAEDPAEAATLTSRGNLVAVVSNGTAVLGLGAIGPLAAKPVMEGKAVLFKKFAGIDAFDIEVKADEPERLIEVVAALEPTFGAINLEDIKAPECFIVEEALKERMNIPVFHDDQHGTAIIVGAAITNALHLINKRFDEVRLCACGAGAASLACLNLLLTLGLRRENILLTDIEGVVYQGRTSLMDRYKAPFAQATDKRTLREAIAGADIFLGLSAGNLVDAEMVKSMADQPIILALANPTPEISPDVALGARDDVIIATGRSDYPNQVNNVLCFPFIFRGALDCGATAINEAMKRACVDALASLARAEAHERVVAAYGVDEFSFGRDYLIPKPFDPRLCVELPIAVARAAAESGVATRPIADITAYRQRLNQFVYRSGLVMKPIFERVRGRGQRIVFTDGEEEAVLRAAQVLVDERLAAPILIGRPEVIAARVKRYGLRLADGVDIEITNPQSDPRYNDYVEHYRRKMRRAGISPAAAKEAVRTRPAVIAAVMVDRGEADAMIAGPVGRFPEHLGHIQQIIGRAGDMHDCSTLHALILERGVLFLADTYVSHAPSALEIAETTLAAAERVRRFGIEPKIALLSHSNFGSSDHVSALRMREALDLILTRAPGLEVDGEMHADAALSSHIRARSLPESRLTDEANLLIFPDLDAANIAYNLLKVVTDAVAVGPILLGPCKPAHIVTTSITARGLVNLGALAALEALESAPDSQASLAAEAVAQHG